MCCASMLEEQVAHLWDSVLRQVGQHAPSDEWASYLSRARLVLASDIRGITAAIIPGGESWGVLALDRDAQEFIESAVGRDELFTVWPTAGMTVALEFLVLRVVARNRDGAQREASAFRLLARIIPFAPRAIVDTVLDAMDRMQVLLPRLRLHVLHVQHAYAAFLLQRTLAELITADIIDEGDRRVLEHMCHRWANCPPA